MRQCELATVFLSKLEARIGPDSKIELHAQLKGYEASAPLWRVHRPETLANPGLVVSERSWDHDWFTCQCQLPTAATVKTSIKQRAKVGLLFEGPVSVVSYWKTTLDEEVEVEIRLDASLHVGAQIAGNCEKIICDGVEVTLSAIDSHTFKATGRSEVVAVRTREGEITSGDESSLFNGDRLWSIVEAFCKSLATTDYRHEDRLKLLPRS